jgi:hypothetical protein
MSKTKSCLKVNTFSKKIKISEEFERPDKIYEKMQDNYIKDGLIQEILIFLKIIVISKFVPLELKNLPLLRMLKETCKDFLLNKPEITMWNIFLENIVWTDKSKPLQILLLYSAYAAKSCMSSDEDIKLIQVCISNKYSGFLTGYKQWHQLNEDKLRIPIRYFNQQFNLFSKTSMKSIELINYNFYVDDLLQIAPPSGICEKEVKLEFNEEPEDTKLPDLLNLNSVLEFNDLPILIPSRNNSCFPISPLEANKEFSPDILENYTASESPTKTMLEEIYQF